MFLKTLAHCLSPLSETAASSRPGTEFAAAKRHAASGHGSVVAEEACRRLGSKVDR